MNTEESKNQESTHQNMENNTQEELKNESNQDSVEVENNNGEMTPLEKKELEYNELHDKFIRLFSEFDNFKKRTAKEKLELTFTAGADILKEILPTMDDFERAIANNEKTDDLAQVKEGFNLIYNKLNANLTKKGLVVMDPKGLAFDSDKHEALTQIPAPTEDMKGKVVDVIEKGYSINDKILRFAKVVVGQ
jgi:molecular chaperone GrpE